MVKIYESYDQTYVGLRQIIIELHAEMDLRQVLMKLERFAEGGKLFAESTLGHRRVQRPNFGRSHGGNSCRLALAPVAFKPVLKK